MVMERDVEYCGGDLLKFVCHVCSLEYIRVPPYGWKVSSRFLGQLVGCTRCRTDAYVFKVILYTCVCLYCTVGISNEGWFSCQCVHVRVSAFVVPLFEQVLCARGAAVWLPAHYNGLASARVGEI